MCLQGRMSLSVQSLHYSGWPADRRPSPAPRSLVLPLGSVGRQQGTRGHQSLAMLCSETEGLLCSAQSTMGRENRVKVEQLERKSQSYKFKKFAKIQNFWIWNKPYTWHTFQSCLIRCVNMKWIRRVSLKIQSGHNSVHRRTGWNQYTPLQLCWVQCTKLAVARSPMRPVSCTGDYSMEVTGPFWRLQKSLQLNVLPDIYGDISCNNIGPQCIREVTPNFYYWNYKVTLNTVCIYTKN